MQFAERTIFLHLAYDIIHHLQQILLPFLHQYANLTMSKGSVQQWGCEPGVGLHIVGSLCYLRYHHVGLTFSNKCWYFLVLLVNDDVRVSQVLVGKLLIQSTRIHHHADFGLVDVGQRLVVACLRSPAKDGLAVSQIAVAHEHGLTSGIGDGDAANSEVEQLRLR